MYGRARNNPNPRQEIVTGDLDYINKHMQETAYDYRFYARVLRVIYNKPKLRESVLSIMKGMENIIYFKIPDRK